MPNLHKSKRLLHIVSENNFCSSEDKVFFALDRSLLCHLRSHSLFFFVSKSNSISAAGSLINWRCKKRFFSNRRLSRLCSNSIRLSTSACSLGLCIFLHALVCAGVCGWGLFNGGVSWFILVLQYRNIISI